MESTFDGSVLGNFGTSIVRMLLSMFLGFVLGIGIAMGIVYKYKWIMSHTIVDGKRLNFVGTWSSLWGKIILWILLSIVTIGIYAIFFLPVARLKWFATNTHKI